MRHDEPAAARLAEAVGALRPGAVVEAVAAAERAVEAVEVAAVAAAWAVEAVAAEWAAPVVEAVAAPIWIRRARGANRPSQTPGC